MHLSGLIAFKKIGALAIILVTLWLGGVGCSSCCATGLADACCEEGHKKGFPCATENQKADSCCETTTEKSCCQKSSQKNDSASTGASIKSLGSIGCSLLPARLEAFTSSVVKVEAPPLQSEVPALLLILPVVLPRTIFTSDSSLIRNRGGTYIQHCALLI